MMILPDTSCWIEFFRPRGNEAVRSQMLGWLTADALAICGPIRTEILRGARKRETSRIIDAFAALPHLDTVDAEIGCR